MTAQMKPADRKEQILDAALAQAQKVGYQNITRQAIAEKCGVSTGLINLHFSTMTQLKRDVIRAAIRRRCLPVIAQAIAAGDKHAKRAPDDLKTAAVQSLL